MNKKILFNKDDKVLEDLKNRIENENVLELNTIVINSKQCVLNIEELEKFFKKVKKGIKNGAILKTLNKIEEKLFQGDIQVSPYYDRWKKVKKEILKEVKKE